MKKASTLVLLSAGILLSLAGCQKGTQPGHGGEGNAVRFGVKSGSIDTRTSYGDYGTGYQMINWSDDDLILIWSDNAINRDDRPGKSAVYELLNIDSSSGKECVASPNRATEDGLVYLDDNTTQYQFWGIYPSNKYLGEIPTAGSVSFSVPATQKRYQDPVTTDGNIVENPDMSNAVMLATSQKVKKDDLVNLKFYAAFTAFEFEIRNNTGDALTLRNVQLASGTEETPGVLAGDVTATLATPDGKATLAMKADGASSATVTYTFGNGTPVSIAAGKSLKFTVFTTAVSNLSGLTASFTYGSGIVHRATFKKSGTPITFNAGYKYRLLGIVLPDDWYFSELNLEGEPINWFYDAPETDNKNYPEATQFEVVGAANVYWDKPYAERGPYEKYRQYWLMDNDDVATVTFKVLSPVGYYWLVEVVDPDNAFVVTGNGTAEGGLKGLIQNKKIVGEGVSATEISTTTNVTLKIKAADATDTDEHKLYLKTYAVSDDGKTKYSLDSETQTYDLVVNPAIGPRGYHYFVLNNSTIVTD